MISSPVFTSHARAVKSFEAVYRTPPDSMMPMTESCENDPQVPREAAVEHDGGVVYVMMVVVVVVVVVVWRVCRVVCAWVS